MDNGLDGSHLLAAQNEELLSLKWAGVYWVTNTTGPTTCKIQAFSILARGPEGYNSRVIKPEGLGFIGMKHQKDNLQNQKESKWFWVQRKFIHTEFKIMKTNWLPTITPPPPTIYAAE